MSARPEFQTELFEKGVAMRREVLGDAHVDRSLAGVTDLTATLQKMVTEWAWGDIWQRPALSKPERSMLNIGMLTALNRSHELRAHVRGALRNGVSEEKVVEVILQTAIYCGFPAALDSMRTVAETIEAYRKEVADGAD
ncbi:carboxymuconolactone decarboxylase family protein [Thalassobaculum sp. OXR-137]|uniref:carboxymuconolactone decarboxylase family protein n=1 Tax=Thalassobaculum sp. OXR-137 TaxID=3100173 RepID=UPI002AC94029|nr:carboxymuconolactone decarboxylase family protein [Thalassobaculum sp. OXR-137]WPZ32349.1 carboxymuconolactone decarboxylase family protein [Thalassobaculum sp. OXR-137]